MLGDAFSRGFLNQLSFGRPYDETAGLLDETHYLQTSLVGQHVLGIGTNTAQPASALEQPSSYGPRFSQAEWHQMVKERYEVSTVISFTLARILRNVTCRRTLAELRDDGWLDWHLLLAIFNVATNYRVRQETGSSSPSLERMKHIAQEFPKRAETPDTPNIPLHHFSKENLRQAFDLAILSVAKRLGLHIDRETPNINGVRRLLDRRYGFMEDVPHTDLLAGQEKP